MVWALLAASATYISICILYCFAAGNNCMFHDERLLLDGFTYSRMIILQNRWINRIHCTAMEFDEAIKQANVISILFQKYKARQQAMRQVLSKLLLRSATEGVAEQCSFHSPSLGISFSSSVKSTVHTQVYLWRGTWQFVLNFDAWLPFCTASLSNHETG